jgi:hypothetical protein
LRILQTHLVNNAYIDTLSDTLRCFPKHLHVSQCACEDTDDLRDADTLEVVLIRLDGLLNESPDNNVSVLLARFFFGGGTGAHESSIDDAADDEPDPDPS